MTGFLAFARKELLEQVRTFRLPILMVAFLLVGLASPILAKLTPELLAGMAGDDLGGMEIVIAKDPDATDALFQYQKNFALLPLLVILLTIGAVSGEKSRRTAPMVLVKPVSRLSFLLAKVGVPAVLVLGGTVLAAGGCLLYTHLLFGEIDLGGFALMNGLLALLLWVYLALTLLGSVLTSSVAGSAGFGLGGFVLFAILGSLPGVGRYTPGALSSAVTDLVLGRDPVGLASGVASSAVLTVGLLVAAALVLRRQEL